MLRRDLIVRAAGLVLTGELAVHQLRYLIAPGEEGVHGYLPLLGVVSVVALAIGAGQLAAVLERARSTGRHDRVHLTFARAWALLAAGVLALFWVQEAAEALLLGASASALVAPVAAGGWVALPLTVVLSALLALALTGARNAVRAAALRARAKVAPARPRRRRLPAPAALTPSSPLALNRAGRAPPLAA